MKKTISIIIVLVITAISYYLGYQHARQEANERAKEMILNDEIPNFYMEVWTVDYLINNANGDLQKQLPEPKKNNPYKSNKYKNHE